MILSAIVAAADNNVIGRNNQLPWNLPADLKYFKDTTWGKPVIMGRKTFDSMGGKPLRGRENIIITRQPGWTAEGVIVAHSLQEAVQYVSAPGTGEAFITGGEEIFRQSMSILQRIYLTRIYHHFEGDTFFPHIDEKEWQLVKDDLHQPDEKNKYAYSFQVWERKQLS